MTKKLKEFCHKLNNPPTLSWCKLQKNGQKPSLPIPSDDELIDASDGVRPYFWAVVPEEMEELWDEVVEGPVEGVRVQHLCRVLADLLQSAERALARRVDFRVQHLAE